MLLLAGLRCVTEDCRCDRPTVAYCIGYRPTVYTCMFNFIQHLYSPRMVEEIKEEKTGTSNKQTVIWPNYLKYSV